MPVYRYQLFSVNINKLLQTVPGPLTLNQTGPFVCVDITADATSKADLDEAMNLDGWDYLATDPTDPPNKAAGKINLANNQKDQTSTAKVAGAGALDAAGERVAVTTATSASCRVNAFFQPGLTPPVGVLYTKVIVPGTSMTIASTAGAADAGQVIYWQIWEPIP